jgi:cysteine desulfurase / selenocysteine lyase
MTLSKENFVDFLNFRHDFPMLKKKMHGKPLIYFDSAATSQKPQVVIDSLTDFYQNHYGTVHRAVYELAVHSTELYQEVRKKVQKFIKAKNEHEIIFTRGTTESINMVAYSFGKAFVKKNDEILISEIEHHSNIVPWQILCEDRGAVLRVIPVNEKGEIILEEYAKLLNEKTKLVAVAHVSNSLGTVHPIKELTAMAHQAGAKILVDAAQSAPHMPLDVQDLDVDFLVFSGHKICGPTGVGVLYGKESLLEAMPPYQGGGDMIETVDFLKTTYNVLPLKFEAGTPMFAEVIALGSAIDYLTSIGMEKIHHWEQILLEYATERMLMIKDLQIFGTAAHKGAIISFLVKGIHHLDLGTMLDLQGIAIRTGHHCSQPTMRRFSISGTARVSFYLYNNKEEIDDFIDALTECIKMLK